MHIAVDDHSRLAYAEVLPDEKATTAAGLLRRAVAYYRRYGVNVAPILERALQNDAAQATATD